MASTEVGLSSVGKDRAQSPEGYIARTTQAISLGVAAFRDSYPIVVEQEIESEESPSGFLPYPAMVKAARIYLSTGHPVADDRIRTYEIEHPTEQRILNRLHIQGIVYANPSSAASYGWKRDLELFLAPLRDLARTRQAIRNYMAGEGEKISIRRITASLGIVVDELVGGRRIFVGDPGRTVSLDNLFTTQHHPAFIHGLGRDEVGYIRQELGMTRAPIENDDNGKIQSLTISCIYPFASQNVNFIHFDPPIEGRCDADDAEGYKQFVLDRKPWAPYVIPVSFNNVPAFYAGFPDELNEKTRVVYQKT